MGDRSVAGMSGPGRYWRSFAAEVLAQKAVFINGVLCRGAVSPIEHVWRRRLMLAGSSLQHQRVLEVLCYVVVVFGVSVA